MRIHANLSAINTNNRMKINQTELSKSLEKLSSGYKINRAAEDAAGLTISEGMRAQIRGLNRAVLNAQDGLSYVYTSDAIVQEASQILQRMRELTIQSQNDTLADRDRETIQKEITALKESINSMSANTSYNDSLKAVEMHEAQYGLLEGIRQFDGAVYISEGINDSLLIIANGETTAVQIPAGKYEPIEELVDTLDTIIYNKNPNIIFSLTEDKRLAVQVEYSPDIAKIKGSASSLFFDYEIGNKPGMIIGTTDYSTGNQKLRITAGQNDTLSFYIGPINKASLTFPAGDYTREDTVGYINQYLQSIGADAEAALYGEKNISIYSDTFAVTGLNGNMFKVDAHTSVLYDNVNYGRVSKSTSYVLGAKDISSGATLDDRNSYFTISAKTKDLTQKIVQVNLVSASDNLPKEYTATELIGEIQQQLDDANLNVDVSIRSNRLYFENKFFGNGYNVKLENYSENVRTALFDQMMTNYYSPTVQDGRDIAATITGNYADRSTMTIDSTNNKFEILVNDVNHSITITEGSYTVDSMISFLQTESDQLNLGILFNKKGFGSSQALEITSDVNKIQLQNSSASNILFGGNTIDYPTIRNGWDGAPTYPVEGTVGPPEFEQYAATATGKVNLSSGLTVTDANNQLSFNVQGETHTIQLANRFYTQDELQLALNVKLANTGVSAKIDSSYLVLTTDKKGRDVTLSNVTGLGMERSYPKSLPINDSTPEKTNAIVSGYSTFSSVQTIQVTDTNNSMSFDFLTNGISQSVNITIPNGPYSTDTLLIALKSSIINVTPPVDVTFELEDTPSGKRIKLIANTEGSQHQFSNISGELYKDIFTRRDYLATPNQTTAYSSITEAYTVGRTDLDNQIEIFPTTNDILTFDVNYRLNKYTLDVQIPAGTYSPSSLAVAFNAALKEKLIEQNLPEDLLTAQIGVQSADQNVSNANKFVLIEKAKNDGRNDNGNTIIDGVRGSAAYTFFYQSNGVPKPSYVTGVTNLSQGLTITEEYNDELSIDVNNETFNLKFPAGTYAANDLLKVINGELIAEKTGLIATYHENKLRLSYKENGMIPIDGITGNARDDLFFKTERRKGDNAVHLQIGANQNQGYTVNQTTLSDRLLRINTISVLSAEKAKKALNRIDGAVNMVTMKLGNLGAVQNRLERVLNINKNVSENLVRAESQIRDADMAKETMKFTKQNILSQAMQAMLAQATKTPQAVLDLLK
ncbi:flagellin [Solibacillus silvestris]